MTGAVPSSSKVGGGGSSPRPLSEVGAPVISGRVRGGVFEAVVVWRRRPNEIAT